MNTDKNGFFARPPRSQSGGVRRAIRKQVMVEYQRELEQAIGWRKYLVKRKLDAITEIRYRRILFLPDAPSLPGGSNP